MEKHCEIMRRSRSPLLLTPEVDTPGQKKVQNQPTIQPSGYTADETVAA